MQQSSMVLGPKDLTRKRSFPSATSRHGHVEASSEALTSEGEYPVHYGLHAEHLVHDERRRSVQDPSDSFQERRKQLPFCKESE